jgi:hypothetical protein
MPGFTGRELIPAFSSGFAPVVACYLSQIRAHNSSKSTRKNTKHIVGQIWPNLRVSQEVLRRVRGACQGRAGKPQCQLDQLAGTQVLKQRRRDSSQFIDDSANEYLQTQCELRVTNPGLQVIILCAGSRIYRTNNRRTNTRHSPDKSHRLSVSTRDRNSL